MSGELVSVTGGSGFVGAHCIAQLLARGYRVRTTVRSQTREAYVRAQVAASGATAGTALSFAVADLGSDTGWSDAVAGCDFVLHVASPFPLAQPRDADELVIPAREGTLRVLRAARDAGVKRVVVTSSFAAVGYGRGLKRQPYTEEDWTDPDGVGVTAYTKSKTLAERAAWDFIAREGGPLELAVVNPVIILGPALGGDFSTSLLFLRRLLAGGVPALPRLPISVVDVRDVADLHLRAMTHPDAAGQRFLAAAGGPVTLPDIAALLRRRLGHGARRVPSRVLPDWVVRAIAPIIPPLKQLAPQLGNPKTVSNEKARTMLGWAPHSNADAIVAAAESLLRVH